MSSLLTELLGRMHSDAKVHFPTLIEQVCYDLGVHSAIEARRNEHLLEHTDQVCAEELLETLFVEILREELPIAKADAITQALEQEFTRSFPKVRKRKGGKLTCERQN